MEIDFIFFVTKCIIGHEKKIDKVIVEHKDRLSRIYGRRSAENRKARKLLKEQAKALKQSACIRKDVLHKMTTELTKTKSVIGIEDLNVKGMIETSTQVLIWKRSLPVRQRR